MNVFQILILGAQIYASRFAWYILSGVVLAITVIISAGVAACFLIVDALIALQFGYGGTWIQKPLVAAAIGASSVAGLLVFSFMFFASCGAFMRLCAQIGAGGRGISAIEHVEYMQNNAPHFWIIGCVQQGAAAIPALAVLAVSAYAFGFSQIVGGLGFAAALLIWMVLQFPFWLAYPVRIIRGAGVTGCLNGSIKAILKSPLSAAVTLAAMYVLFLVPAISLVLYPIYLFLILAPIVAIMSLAYYEAVEGLLK